MNPWHPFPVIRLLIPFIAGIVTAVGWDWFLQVGYGGIASLWFLVAISCVVAGSARRYRYRWIGGLPLNIFMFLAGVLIAVANDDRNRKNYFGKDPAGVFLVSIADQPKTSNRFTKVTVSVDGRIISGLVRPLAGRALIYFENDTATAHLSYGDRLLVDAVFSKVPDNKNPFSFDYHRYLDLNGINYQAWLKAGKWKSTSLKPDGFLQRTAFGIRDRLLDVLRENYVEGQALAVASALLLGYVNDIDDEIRNDYAATGAMHILSVSGMHVGIIFLFLEFVLGFLYRIRHGKWIRAMVIIGFVWIYALVTGLSPSVLRASAMISLPILAKSIRRDTGIVNIIASSGFILLTIDPALIFDTGFQLSYLAVMGIVALYQPLNQLFQSRWWLVSKTWSLLAVSLAAQAATAPLCLYYFHQFPNYFMLTNLVVVPLSTLIIYSGIGLLVISPVATFAALTGKLLNIMIIAMNSAIHWIETLPFSTTRGVYITEQQMFLLFGVLACGSLFLMRKRISFLNLLTACVILLVMHSMINDRAESERKRVVVFNTRRNALIEFNRSNRSVFFTGRCVSDPESKAAGTTRIIDNEINGSRVESHRVYWFRNPNRHAIDAGNFMDLRKTGDFTWFAGKTLFIADHWLPPGLKFLPGIDILVMSDNPDIRLRDLVTILQPQQIVIDATNKPWRVREWEKEAAELKLKVHVVSRDGAFIKEF